MESTWSNRTPWQGKFLFANLLRSLSDDSSTPTSLDHAAKPIFSLHRGRDMLHCMDTSRLIAILARMSRSIHPIDLYMDLFTRVKNL